MNMQSKNEYIMLLGVLKAHDHLEDFRDKKLVTFRNILYVVIHIFRIFIPH